MRDTPGARIITPEVRTVNCVATTSTAPALLSSAEESAIGRPRLPRRVAGHCDHERAMTFTEVYLGHVTIEDFRKNPRGELGTRTATLHRERIQKLRKNWVYRLS